VESANGAVTAIVVGWETDGALSDRETARRNENMGMGMQNSKV
jgi:hypothetical protein